MTKNVKGEKLCDFISKATTIGLKKNLHIK